MPKSKTDEPTLDEWIVSATELARMVRAAFDNPKSVKRSELKAALVRFERCDFRAM